MEGTILLVDDETDNLGPMKLFLQENYFVLTAESGEEGLSLLEHHPVDLIVSDQRMPTMTGVELFAIVRKKYPDIVRIILTGFSDFQAMMESINKGEVYRYILKPWDVDDMRMTIKQALEWKRLRLAEKKLLEELKATNRELTLRNQALEEAQHTIIKQEKLAAVGRFASEVVHEMNSHLQIIFGLNAHLSFTENVDPTLLEQLEAQAKSLSELASDIRDYARETSLPFELSQTHPEDPVREVIRICSYHPEFKGLHIRLENAASSKWDLDPRLIRQLMLNLLKNAAKASPKRSEILTSIEETDDELILRVVDHGIGIPKETQKKIWEPFYSTWDYDGTGLGLSICKRVASAHRGEISCENTPGGGATFVVRIPREKPHA